MWDCLCLDVEVTVGFFFASSVLTQKTIYRLINIQIQKYENHRTT